MKSFEEIVTMEELRKYLKTYALSENNYDTRVFALELLIKLEKGVGTVAIPTFGATQSQDASPSVERAITPSLGMDK